MGMKELDILEDVYNQLRPYQQEAIQIMKNRKHNLHFDDMGLGKTVTTLFTALYKAQDLLADGTSREIIVITCPTKALYVWKNEIEKWFNLPSLIYVGTTKKREKLKAEFKDYLFVITTYAMLPEFNGVPVRGLIADEIHEAGLLNHKTQTYEMFHKFYSKISWSFLLTGTPVRQGVVDLYAPLHLVAPEVFKNYWSFVNIHCNVTNTPFGKQIERNPKNIAEFRKLLNNYMVRRIKSEVLKDLPGKQRKVVPLQMTQKQAKLHYDILTEFIYSDDDNVLLTPNAMTALLRARQALVSPRLLGIDDDGAGLLYIADEGKQLLENDKPIVIFTPFRAAIPIIADVIKEMGLNTKVYTISGELNPAEFAKQWQGFQDNPLNNKVLICVIKSGASFHATTAADCFFLGYEWDFNLNAQSEDRLCRLGQQNFVNCNYLLCEGTADEQVKARLNEKNAANNWIIGTKDQYKAMLASVRSRVGGIR